MSHILLSPRTWTKVRFGLKTGFRNYHVFTHRSFVRNHITTAAINRCSLKPNTPCTTVISSEERSNTPRCRVRPFFISIVNFLRKKYVKRNEIFSSDNNNRNVSRTSILLGAKRTAREKKIKSFMTTYLDGTGSLKTRV